MDPKSSIQSQEDLGKSKCLVRFHNCTAHRVTPYWIDFKGQPIKYSALDRGKSINLDTYSNHLWFFKQENSTTRSITHTTDNPNIKILAIPEESIDVSALKLASASLKPVKQSDKESWLTDCILTTNTCCPLCKYLFTRHLLKPNQVPCPHLYGESKFTVSDFNARTYSSDFSSYIYSCNDEAHRSEHSKTRRNIYLVQSFRNLRELCFIKLNSSQELSSIQELNLPKSLEREYIQFVTSLNRLDQLKT